MKIYIAGPMRGLSEWNFPAFDQAEKRWREAGHIAFSPASIACALGYGPSKNTGFDREHLKHVMMSDVTCLMHADAIALLPGWEKSSGSTVELALAQFLGIKVFDAITMKEIDPVATPWYELPTTYSV